MKKSLLTMIAAAMSLSIMAATSTPEGFTDDLDAAIAASKKSGKTVYAVFSGSDWCYWCKVLEAGYLSKKDFVNEASKEFELVFIDTPRDKSKLSENARAKNPTLIKKYGIRYFPTVMFISADGIGSGASSPDKGATPKEWARQLAKEAKSLSKTAKKKP